LIPEISWTFENVCDKILERERHGKRFTLVVVAEGAHLPEGGEVTCERRQENRQVRLGGIGNVVAYEIQRRLKQDTRVVVLGHLQRGGAPTTFDRVLATQFGAHAVRLVEERRFGEMVCYQPPAIESVPISEAVHQLSRVDVHGSAVQAARALGVSFGDPAPEGGPFAACSTIRKQSRKKSPVAQVSLKPASLKPVSFKQPVQKPAAAGQVAEQPVPVA